MLVVKVELHSAVTGRVKLLAKLRIWNDVTGTPERGNYRGRIDLGKQARSMADTGAVTDFPRRSTSALELVRRMLNAMAEVRR